LDLTAKEPRSVPAVSSSADPGAIRNLYLRVATPSTVDLAPPRPATSSARPPYPAPNTSFPLASFSSVTLPRTLGRAGVRRSSANHPHRRCHVVSCPPRTSHTTPVCFGAPPPRAEARALLGSLANLARTRQRPPSPPAVPKPVRLQYLRHHRPCRPHDRDQQRALAPRGPRAPVPGRRG